MEKSDRGKQVELEKKGIRSSEVSYLREEKKKRGEIVELIGREKRWRMESSCEFLFIYFLDSEHWRYLPQCGNRWGKKL